MRSLCLLAGPTYQGQYALRIVITGTHDARRLLDLSSMKPVADRIEAVYEIEPLTPHETMLYLHGRLAACDVTRPDLVHSWSGLAKNANGMANGPNSKPAKSQYHRSALRDLAIQ